MQEVDGYIIIKSEDSEMWQAWDHNANDYAEFETEEDAIAYASA